MKITTYDKELDIFLENKNVAVVFDDKELKKVNNIDEIIDSYDVVVRVAGGKETYGSKTDIIYFNTNNKTFGRSQLNEIKEYNPKFLKITPRRVDNNWKNKMLALNIFFQKSKTKLTIINNFTQKEIESKIKNTTTWNIVIYDLLKSKAYKITLFGIDPITMKHNKHRKFFEYFCDNERIVIHQQNESIKNNRNLQIEKDNKTVVVIPARGGSKGIPRKNVLHFEGKPLIAWNILAARASKLVDEVWVSTDDDEIEQVSRNYGANILRRGEDISNDTATSESVLLDFAEKVEFEKLVFLQCTSPYTTTTDIDNAIMMSEDYDSVVSVTPSCGGRLCGGFDWVDGKPDYNIKKRPRRQDMPVKQRENGAIYITSKKNLKKNNCRVSGKIGLYEMPGNRSFEIDEPEDIGLTPIRKVEKLKEFKNEKFVVTTVCNDLFVPGLKSLIKSIIKHNVWFNYDIVVFHNNSSTKLSNKSKKDLTNFYSKIKFKNVDDIYDKINIKKNSRKRFISSFLTIETFNMIGYDKAIFLDSDMLCLGDLSDVFSYDIDFGVTRDTNKYNLQTKNSYNKNITFNGGFLVVGKRYLNSKTYNDLFDLCNNTTTDFADQFVMNEYFKNKNIFYFNSKYNALKRCFPDEKFNNVFNDVRLLHFVGKKPWINDKDFEKIFKEKDKNIYKKCDKLWNNNKESIIKKKKSILLIGNSPIVLKHEIGDVIDNFDEVVRFNDFETHNYEKFVGTKTTIWGNSGSPAVKQRKEDFNEIWVPVALHKSDKAFKKWYDNIAHTNKTRINKENIIRYNKNIGFNNKEIWGSTGIYSICYAVENYENVFIHGFNFFDDCGKIVNHYFKEKTTENCIRHDGKKEKTYINNLVNNGNIQYIIKDTEV